MADKSLDDVIRDRNIRFNRPNAIINTAGKKISTNGRIGVGSGKLGLTSKKDVRDKIILNKRAGVKDARANITAPKKMISLKRIAPAVKQRITAPGQKSGIAQTGNDARKKLNTIKLQNRDTVSLRTNKNQLNTGRFNTNTLQQIAKDIRSNKINNQTGVSNSTLLKTLNSISGGNRNARNIGNRFNNAYNRNSAPVQYVTEEVVPPIEYEEMPFEEYYEPEPIYETYEEPTEVVQIRNTVPMSTGSAYRNNSPRVRRVATNQLRVQGQRTQVNRNRPARMQARLNGQQQVFSQDVVDGDYDEYEGAGEVAQPQPRQQFRGMNSMAYSENTTMQQQNMGNWTSTPIQKRPTYNDVYPQQQKRQMMSSNLISRLDHRQEDAQDGFKVLVSNLHPKVTLEDIKELFGNIGPLRTARMPQRGVAEVILLNEQDAHSSVKAYHSRLLDGQPMNVTVMAQKTLNPRMGNFNNGMGVSMQGIQRRPAANSILRSARGRTGLFM